ncbi:MAG: selenocysteine-specific translation elongation factor [Proteobacteria bacterium]|nr:selenocysteine-specific translation elongation factor [Pseudomonadota bacterium]
MIRPGPLPLAMIPYPIVLGTAGHIDHGKTSLVHALTGIDTDRLAVEKQRGITTELGFARMALGDRQIAVVDVPGHERFIRSMVAGASGLDLVCLVIAADEGVMPQTREHLAICHLLGLRAGLVALTKIDLVDDDWRALVEADVRAALAGTFLADAPIVGVSTRQPATLDHLRAALAALIDGLPTRVPTGVFRLPIDRVFTMKGFGTVVTGTLLGGTVAVGDELVVIPGDLSTRVRHLEMHNVAVERAQAGHRVALNLGNLAVDELARGDLLVHPGRVADSHILDVEVQLLPGTTLPDRSKVVVHHAASATLATLVMVARAAGIAQLRLDARTPLGALPGDRFILRQGATIGGGRVVRVLAPKARADDHAVVVATLASARDVERAALEVKAASVAGLTLEELARRLGGAPELDVLADVLVAGPHVIHAQVVAQLEAKILALVVGELGREVLRAQLPAALPTRVFDAILAGLGRRALVAIDGDKVTRVAAARAPLAPADRALLAQFLAWGVEPERPTPTTKTSIERLIAVKQLVRIKPDLVMHVDVVADVRARLLAHLAAHATIDPTQWKALTGASRKFTIPLAEYFDAEKLTLRVGDLRRKR